MAPIVQKVDSATHNIYLYPVDSVIVFPNTYPLDSDLSDGSAIRLLNNWGLVKPVGETAPKFLFLASICVPGFGYMPWLAC